jgi:pimeloyl-ACP methyl ester carboxylesterase
MQQQTMHINGIDLFVRSLGDPAAPLVLFLHGFPEFSGAWDDVLPAFAPDFHAVAPDQRGYARSSKPEGVDAYRVKSLVRDVLAWGTSSRPVGRLPSSPTTGAGRSPTPRRSPHPAASPGSR